MVYTPSSTSPAELWPRHIQRRCPSRYVVSVSRFGWISKSFSSSSSRLPVSSRTSENPWNATVNAAFSIARSVGCRILETVRRWHELRSRGVVIGKHVAPDECSTRALLWTRGKSGLSGARSLAPHGGCG